MSRLIEADKLRRIFEDSEYPCKLQEALLGIIDAQPTAFDVKNVIEQIESIKEKEQGACTDEECGFCDYFNDCWDGDMCDKLALDKAIEIVKGGGVE